MIDQQDLKRIRKALEDKESPRVYGEDRGGRMITLLVLKDAKRKYGGTRK